MDVGAVCRVRGGRVRIGLTHKLYAYLAVCVPPVPLLSKKDSKAQESIQSSTTHVPGYQIGK